MPTLDLSKFDTQPSRKLDLSKFDTNKDKRTLDLSKFDTQSKEETDLLGQFAIGAINEAAFGFPLFIAEKIDPDKVKQFEPGNTAEKVARGTGSVAGFLAGLPGKAFVKGGQLALKGALKISPRILEAGIHPKALSAGARLLRGAIESAGSFSAIEALSAPKDSFTEKAFTVPLSATLGAGFGVAGEALKPVVSRFVSKITKGRKSAFTSELSNNVLTEVDRLKQRADSMISKGNLEKAQVFVNENFVFNKKLHKDFQNKIINKAVISGKDLNFVPEETIRHLGLIRKSTPLDGFITSGRTYANRQGPTAKQLVGMLDDLVGTSRSRTGLSVKDFHKIRKGMNDKEVANFLDIVEGRTTLSINNKVDNLVKFWQQKAGDIAKEASALEVSVKSANGEIVREFIPRLNNYFPHIIISPSSPKKVVDNVLNSAVKRGDFKNINEARNVWQSYIDFSKGKKGDAILEKLVSTGQAPNKAEASKILRQFMIKGKSRTFGNLERSREVNLPFYDTNIDRVIPQYFEGAYFRLETIKRFGPKDQIKKELISRIESEGGDSSVISTVIDRLTGVDAQTNLPGITPEFLGKVREFQTVTKLGLSAIPNSTQSVNDVFLVGLKNTAKGIKDSLKKEGREFADEIGATLQSTVDDIIRQSTGGASGWTANFLRGVGFTATERMNRTIAANAGKNYVIDLSNKLLRNPGNKFFRRSLQEIRVDPDKILKQGGYNYNDLVRGAQTVVRRAQFESSPLELPIFFTSPHGKVLTQFKTFAFNQAKLMKEAVLGEALKGNMRPMIQAITLMPILGEGVRDVRAILSGKKRDKKGMERIAENISAVGGLGIVSDIYSSARYGGVAETLIGPTGSDLAQLIEAIVLASEGKPKRLQIETVEKVPVVGSLLRNAVK